MRNLLRRSLATASFACLVASMVPGAALAAPERLSRRQIKRMNVPKERLNERRELTFTRRTPLYYRLPHLRRAIENRGKVKLELQPDGAVKIRHTRSGVSEKGLASLGYELVRGRSGDYLRRTPNKGTTMWVEKQDDIVGQEHSLGKRRIFVPNRAEYGPADEYIVVKGTRWIERDADGDLDVPYDKIHSTKPDERLQAQEDVDATSVYGKVRQAINFTERVLFGDRNPEKKLVWGHNQIDKNNDFKEFTYTKRDPVQVKVYGKEMKNAYADLVNGELVMGYFVPRDKDGKPMKPIFTARSHDVVTHEAYHLILHSIMPKLIFSRSAQSGGIHEATGDLGTIFTAIAEPDQREHMVVDTKGDLRNPNIIASLAESFGYGIGRGRKAGLRNALNELTMKDVGAEVHDISRVLSGAVYDVLVSAYERTVDTQKHKPTEALAKANYHTAKLYFRALEDIAKQGTKHPTFADIGNAMIKMAERDPYKGRGDMYAEIIKNTFEKRFIIGENATAPKEKPRWITDAKEIQDYIVDLSHQRTAKAHDPEPQAALRMPGSHE